MNGVDFAPNEPHIFIRRDGVPYYVPELFYLNKFYNIVCPLLISDINALQYAVDIYGTRSFANNCGILVLNNPVQFARVFGLVLHVVFNDNKNFYTVTIDDFSGSDLSIPLVMFPECFMSSGLSLDHAYGRIVEASGTLKKYMGRLEMKCTFLQCIGRRQDLHIELAYWETAIKFRKQIQSEQWVYNPPIDFDVESQLKAPYLKDSRRDFLEPPREDIVVIEDIDMEHISESKIEAISTNSIAKSTASTNEQSVTAFSTASFPTSAHTTHPQVVTPPSRPILHRKQTPDSVVIIEERSLASLVITEFQITAEIVKILLDRQCAPIKLVEIYNSPKVNYLLNDLTILRTNLRPDGNVQDFLSKKHEILHSMRHELQKNYNFIIMTKNQVIKLDNLLQLVKHVDGCLNTVKDSAGEKAFHVKKYLKTVNTAYPDFLGPQTNHKMVNVIVEWLVRGDRHNWLYDLADTLWSYVTS